MLGNQLLKLGAKGAVPAERELRLDPVLHRSQTERFKTLHLEPGKRFELKIGQRTTVPQRLRLAQEHRGPAGITFLKRVASISHPLLECVQVQLTWLDTEQVPGRASEQPRPMATVGERLAQAGDLNVQHRFGRTGWLIAEQFVDQLVAGYDPVGMAQQ